MKEWLETQPVRVKGYLGIIVGASLTFLVAWQGTDDVVASAIATLSWFAAVLGVETSVRGRNAAWSPASVRTLADQAERASRFASQETARAEWEKWRADATYAQYDADMPDVDPGDFENPAQEPDPYFPPANPGFQHTPFQD